MGFEFKPNLQSTGPLGTEKSPYAGLGETQSPTGSFGQQPTAASLTDPKGFWDEDDDALTGDVVQAFDETEDSDELKGTPGVAENSDEYQTTYDFLRTADKIAYGAVKGLAGLADFVTVPGWALANTVMPDGTAVQKPFTALLEEFYPEKNYAFEEDPNSYADEVLRITQTAAEFVSPAGPTNLMVKGASKGAYATTQLVEHSLAAASGVGFQATLEAGGSETAAVAAAFVAPMSPELFQAAWKATKSTTRGTMKLALKAPLAGMVAKEVEDTSRYALAVAKADLLENPDKWTKSWYGRTARSVVLKSRDTPRSLEQQREELQSISERIHKVLPLDNTAVVEHVNRMKRMQGMMNEGRSHKIELTIDQIYRPILKQINDTEGFDALLDSIILTNAEAYNKQVRNNQKVFQEILKGDVDKLLAEDAETFTKIFTDHLDNINNEYERVASRALGVDPTASSVVPGATVYEHSYVPQEQLTKATEDLYKIMDSAYTSMLDKLPADLNLDTTPLKRSIVDMYENMGTLSDPASVPPYIRSLMNKMVALGGGEDIAAKHKDLLNRESGLKGKQKELIAERKLAVQNHKKQLESIDPEAPKEDIKALKSQYQAEYEEAIGALEQKRRPVDEELARLEVEKREYRVSEVHESFEGIPEPTFTDLGSVREAINLVNRQSRKAFKNKEWDKYENLSFVKRGLEETMDSLQEADPDVYTLYKEVNARYGDFVSRDFNESKARAITDKKGGRQRVLTSDQAVKQLWTEADAETVKRFMTNFDPERPGISTYLDDSMVTLDGETFKGADKLLEVSQDGVSAMRDIVFTDMAQGLREFDMKVYMDPTHKIKDIEDYARKYLVKHKSKLENIPGFEDHPEALRKVVEDLGHYRLQLKALDEKRNLSILQNLTGPGHTIMDIVRDVRKADELVGILDEMSVDQAVTVSQVRKTLFNAFVQRHTTGDRLNADQIIKLLDTTGEARHNLSKILGEEQVGKLAGMAYVSKALETGEASFITTLSSNKFLGLMESHGISAGRIGSLLSRRAVFAPSTGYIAGAFSAKVIDSLGRRQTSRTLKVLFENPFDLTEMDNFVLREMNKLNAREQRLIDRALERGDLTSTVGFLQKTLAKSLHSHLISIGLQVTEEELQGIAKEFLTEPKESPKEMYTEDDITVMKDDGKLTEDDETYMRGQGQVIEGGNE